MLVLCRNTCMVGLTSHGTLVSERYNTPQATHTQSQAIYSGTFCFEISALGTVAPCTHGSIHICPCYQMSLVWRRVRFPFCDEGWCDEGHSGYVTCVAPAAPEASSGLSPCLPCAHTCTHISLFCTLCLISGQGLCGKPGLSNPGPQVH